MKRLLSVAIAALVFSLSGAKASAQEWASEDFCLTTIESNFPNTFRNTLTIHHQFSLPAEEAYGPEVRRLITLSTLDGQTFQALCSVMDTSGFGAGEITQTTVYIPTSFSDQWILASYHSSSGSFSTSYVEAIDAYSWLGID